MKFLCLLFILFCLSCQTSYPEWDNIRDVPIISIDRDTIRKYLTGMWEDTESMVWRDGILIKMDMIELDFNDTSYIAPVLDFIYDENTPKTGRYGITSDLPYVEIIIRKDSVFLEFINIGGTWTHKLNYLSEERMLLGNSKYLRHFPVFKE